MISEIRSEMAGAVGKMDHVNVRAQKLVEAIEAAETKEAAVALAQKALQGVSKDAVLMTIGLFTDLTDYMLKQAKAVVTYIE